MTRFALPATAARPASWLIHAAARLTRPLTMGVRAVVLEGEERVFLVRHTYVPGWHFPGGGVEVGETCRQAVARELREEAGLVLDGEAALHGLFLNRRRDHVAVYLVRRFRLAETPAADWEIAERGFFPVDRLPDGTTAATRARLAEIRQAAAPADLW